MAKCSAHLALCVCGLDEHPPDVPHECVDPDPQCGGAWLDHPTMPTHVLVVRWPGVRPGGINENFPVSDPPPGEPVLERRPDRVPRGPIFFYPPPSLAALLEGDTP